MFGSLFFASIVPLVNGGGGSRERPARVAIPIFLFLGFAWAITRRTPHLHENPARGFTNPPRRHHLAGSDVPPAHITIPPPENVRWQPLPREIVGVYVAPDQRVWTELHSKSQLGEAGF